MHVIGAPFLCLLFLSEDICQFVFMQPFHNIFVLSIIVAMLKKLLEIIYRRAIQYGRHLAQVCKTLLILYNLEASNDVDGSSDGFIMFATVPSLYIPLGYYTVSLTCFSWKPLFGGML